MDTCACGNPANLNGTTCRRCDALHELGLKPGATEVEVKTAHRLYVKAWHPDRFPGDEKSKSAAQEKLKTINAAYEFLSASSSRRDQPNRPKAAAPPTQNQRPTQQKEASAKQPPSAGGRSQNVPPKSNTGDQVPPRPPSPPPPPPPRQSQPWPNQGPTAPIPPQRRDWMSSPGLKTFLRYAAIVCAVGFGRLFWQTFDAKPAANPQAQAEWARQRAKAMEEPRATMPLTNPGFGSEYDHGKDSYSRKQYVHARELFTGACSGGEMRACNYLGYLYAKGLGGPQDTEKARDIYQEACDKGTLSSCASLGSLYQDSGNKDYARQYFRKACDGGLTESCSFLRGLQ